MYVNGKMRPVETLPGKEGGGIKENDSYLMNSSMIYFMYCKNFCKCQNVPQYNKKEKNSKNKNIKEKKIKLRERKRLGF
jgi:hypothetical protein